MNWKTTVTTLSVLALLHSTASEAGPVHPVGKKLAGKKLEAFILKHDFDDGYFGYIFKKGGLFKGLHPQSSGMAGKWMVKDDSITVKSHGLGGGMTEGDFGKDWKFNVEWHDIRLTSTGIFSVSYKDGGFAFKCDAKHCQAVTASLVRPGHSDTALYQKVLEKLSKIESEEVLYIEGSPAKNPRKITEIWYQKGSENAGKNLAKMMEDVIGPVEVREWKWGGPYLTIIIVGQEKPPG